MWAGPRPARLRRGANSSPASNELVPRSLGPSSWFRASLHRGLSEAGIAQLLTDDPRVVVLALDLVDRGSRISGHHHNPPREYACGHLIVVEEAYRGECV